MIKSELIDIKSRLIEIKDADYRDFLCPLIPNVDPNKVIGIRMPALRKLAGLLYQVPESECFINSLPHQYYEENNLHALFLERMTDFEQLLLRLELFLPYIDNWATCDLLRPKVFKEHLPQLLIKIKEWLTSDHPYTVRFGIEMLMCFYLEAAFDVHYNELVVHVKSDEYYVNMMIAWYFATALTKQYEASIPFIEQKRLAKWTHNKAIQKAIESYRIEDSKKDYLRTLRSKV